MTEWEAVGLVVGIRPVGEIDAIATVLVEAKGLQRGFVRAGRSRRARSVWEVGNRVSLRWRARDGDLFGTLSGEAIDQPLDRLVDDVLGLTVLLSACAIVRDTLPMGGEAPLSAAGLGEMIEATRTGSDGSTLARLVRWEVVLLGELGYGLDLAPSSESTERATLVSPRTGRAVTTTEAGEWRDRLLPLPTFLQDCGDRHVPDWLEIEQGLRLTGHFLAREAFVHRERRLPPERQRLLLLIGRLVDRCLRASRSDQQCDRRALGAEEGTG